MAAVLSIDFGTSNTVAALVVGGQAARVVSFDSGGLLPSAVFLAADGSVVVGREAVRSARLEPSRFEPNPKRRIDDGEVLLGDRVVSVVDLIGAVLRVVAVEVRRQLGGVLPDEVRLTHPAGWGSLRRNVLVAAARVAGLGSNIALIPEPVAAAAQFVRLPGRGLPVGGAVAVYDLGGGTFDVAVVGRSGAGDFIVLGEAGLADLGGLDFDQALTEHVGREVSGRDPSRWLSVLRPSDAAGRRLSRALAEDVRVSKESLSKYSQTEVVLPDPFGDVLVTRAEFEGLIRPNLLRSVEVLGEALRSAGVSVQGLQGVFLVGGSSRVPLVAKLISESLGVTPVALDQPETAVALGALLVPIHRGSNRTQAIGPHSGPISGPVSGPISGPISPVSGPMSGATSTASGTPPITGSFTQQTGAQPSSGRMPSTGGLPPTTGRSHTGATPPVPGGPPSAPTGRRSKVPIIAAVAVLLLAATVWILVAKPFSDGDGTAGTSTPPVPNSQKSTTASTGQTSEGSSSNTPTTAGSNTESSEPGPSGSSSLPPTEPSPNNPDGDKPGVGPGSAFTPNELTFLGPAAERKLSACSEITQGFNDSVEAPYRTERVVRCDVTLEDSDKIYGRTLLYVFTNKDLSAAQALMEQVRTDRKSSSTGSSRDPSGQGGSTTAGTLYWVAADELPQIGKSTNDLGVAALFWHAEKSPRLVGALVNLSYELPQKLLDYFNNNFRPR